MGTWGTGAFENDNAMDWVTDALVPARDDGVLDRSLRLAAHSEPDEDLSAPEGEESLAAAEVVAALRGHPAPGLPPEVVAFVRRPRPGPLDRLTQLSLDAIDRTLAVNSELAELWADADPAPWLAAVADLRMRLGLVPVPVATRLGLRGLVARVRRALRRS